MHAAPCNQPRALASNFCPDRLNFVRSRLPVWASVVGKVIEKRTPYVILSRRIGGSIEHLQQNLA